MQPPPKFTADGLARQVAKHGVFEEARNTENLPMLGDPERWAGFANVQFVIDANSNLSQTKETAQILRVQVPQLAARQWRMLSTYAFRGDGVVTMDNVSLSILWGVGQVTIGGPAQVFPFPANGSPFSNACTATDGVVDIGDIVGSAIAVLARVKVTAHGGPATTVSVRVGVSVAPRAL